MGANLSILAPHAHTVAARSYVDVFSNFEFLAVVNNSRFLKTMKAYDKNSGMLVVIKIFIKPVQGGVNLHALTEHLAQEALLLAQHPNVLAWHQITETSAAGYLVRQLAKTSLYDRLSLRPFLAPIEKLWLVYQLLRAAELIHDQLQVCHGDIKTENILLTGSNWLVLSDFAQYIKPVNLPDDNPSEFLFYFDSSNRRSCYVAPERFYSKAEKESMQASRSQWRLQASADMFSIGCVIAELYMDGEATFTLSDLYKYKRGEVGPNFGRIADNHMQDLVRLLLHLDPNKRPSATDLLRSQRGILFPEYFYDFLYSFMSDLNAAKSPSTQLGENYSESDRKIEAIYSNYDKIAAAFNYNYEADEQDRIKSESSSSGGNSASGFPHLKLGLPGIPKNYKLRPSKEVNSRIEQMAQQEGALMILDTIFASIGSLKRPESKCKACELILVLSERVHDDSKLDRSLPYICSLLEDFITDVSRHQEDVVLDPVSFSSKCKLSTRVACLALLTLTNLLETCVTVNAINTLVFPEFICPLLKNIAFLNSPFQEEVALLKCTLARCFPYLAHISVKFKSLVCSDPSEGGDAVTLKDDDMKGLFQSASVRVEPDMKDITEALLTEPNVNVRATLVSNILPLCQYFGVDKTNDIILPHLITYLNDPSYQLRLAFLSSIIEIGNFIGVLSFEQYILPLLIQILCDHELFIVLKVLEIFYYFVREKLINPESDFNAWSIYKDMLQNSILLLLQPNEWIRQYVVFLIMAISDNLLNADRFCFLYPIIKLYLSYDISIITWDTLYPSLTRPISKQVIEMALVWLLNSNSKSLFWKQTKISVFQQNGKRKLVSFSKDMGRSLYAGRMSPKTVSDETAGLSDIPLCFEDRQWVLKLKSVGLEEKELWKVFALKDYLVGINRSGTQSNSSIQREFELASSVNISPKNIFFEICYKSEPIPSGRRGTQISIEAPEASSVSVISHKDSLSVVLPNNGKARASLQTNEANVFGELELRHDENSSHNHHHHLHRGNRSNDTTHRIISTNDEKIISTTIRHNYDGQNPFVFQYLRGVEFDPLIDDFPEFGLIIKGGRESTSSNTKKQFVGAEISSFNLNDSYRTIDAITKVVVCPTSEIIVTGSCSGQVKVWDTAKLESSLGNSASICISLDLAVTDIVFMPHRWVFAVTTMDGQIRLFRVHAVRGKNRKIVKFSKLIPVRSAKLERGYVKSLQFLTTTSKTLCLVVTSVCKLIAFDLIRMEKIFDIQNPLQYGIPQTFVACKTCSWILVGTSDGVLCLWDVRFELLISSWRVAVDGIVERNAEIKKLLLVPTPPNRKKNPESLHFAMIGGTTESDITVWEMPAFACRQYFSAHEETPKIKSYTLLRIDHLREFSAESILAELSLDFDHQEEKGPQVLKYMGKVSGEGNLALVTGDQRVTIWNWKDVSQSVLLFSERRVSFTQNAISSSLCVYYERLIPSDSTNNRKLANDEKITDLCFLSKPYPMLVIVKDDGTMHVYK